MKHVFVETNFLIEVLRPAPSREAQKLLSRAKSGDIQLHVPWASFTEVRRTLTRIIKEDLGFRDDMLRFAVAEMKGARLTTAELADLQKLAATAKAAEAKALIGIEAAVTDLANNVKVIEPSKEVVARTVGVFAIKSLPPFDEIVLGAVLAQADFLVAQGETDLWFCNLNTKDFEPNQKAVSGLDAEYKRLGLRYLPDFSVP